MSVGAPVTTQRTREPRPRAPVSPGRLGERTPWHSSFSSSFSASASISTYNMRWRDSHSRPMAQWTLRPRLGMQGRAHPHCPRPALLQPRAALAGRAPLPSWPDGRRALWPSGLALAAHAPLGRPRSCREHNPIRPLRMTSWKKKKPMLSSLLTLGGSSNGTERNARIQGQIWPFQLNCRWVDL